MPRVFYFAYGSNMDTSTLRGRRGIEWARACAARLSGWRLHIDKPSLLGTGEAMATVVAEAGAEVWGVLYDLEAADYEHLEFTEGVLIDHYRRVRVDVETSDPWTKAESSRRGTLESASMLASDQRDPELRPTTRYMGLLVSGAIEHGLPPAWIQRLQSVEAFVESAEQAAMRPDFDRVLRRSK